MPGLFVAGGALAGMDTGNIFIENGRFHGEKIVEVIAERLTRSAGQRRRLESRRLGPESRVSCSEPRVAAALSARRCEQPGVRAIRIFISSSSTSDSARRAQAVAARAAPASRAARGRGTARAR